MSDNEGIPLIPLNQTRRGNQSNSRTIKLNQVNTEKYCNNRTRNQKYSVLSLIPIVLFHQFKFFLNLYFLLISLSQFIKVLQIGYIITYIAPLAFVLSVTIAKEAYDDFKRYRRDKEANSQQYTKLTETGKINVPAEAIAVGDIIYIHKDQRVPADCILLRTTEESGASFIRTDQLDGETDWKLRLAVPATQAMSSDQALFTLRGSLYAEAPHKDIHKFVGNLTRTVSLVSNNEQVSCIHHIHHISHPSITISNARRELK